VLFGRPRFIDERVIVRLERDDALELLPDPTTRTLVRILIETGLRAIDARTLPLKALSHDTAGAPYLRYFNHKLGREEPDRCMSAALTGGRLPRGLSSAAATPGR